MTARSPTDTHVGDVDRRSFLKAAAAATALPATSGFSSAATSSQSTSMANTTTSTDPVAIGSNEIILGGKLVVGEPGFPTIADAWTAAADGDVIYIHSSYDAQAAGESFPVRLDFRDKEVMLTGGHPSGSVIDASHTSENVLEVVGAGHDDYQCNPVVQNLRIVGGNVGLKVMGAPYSAYQNLVLSETGSHGIEVCTYAASDGTDYGCFGCTFSNCQAWGTGGNGFHLNADAAPHATAFENCHATACQGIGFRLRGAATKLTGGVCQLNHDWGVEVRGGMDVVIEGAYIEGNARGRSFPIEIYMRGSEGASVRDCYFHGINPRGASHDYQWVQRAVNAHTCDSLTVDDCTIRRYGDGAVALFDSMDVDVHAPSHSLSETTLFATEPSAADRTRSDGVILPGDLSGVTGQHEGDRGYHVGTNSEGFAQWHDGAWRVAETTTL